MPYQKRTAAEYMPDHPAWVPRPLQQAILDANERFKALVVHRRFGKTELAVKALVDVAAGVTCKLIEPRAYYLGTTLQGVTRVAWAMVKRFASEFDAKLNKWDLSATFPGGGVLQLLSATNYQGHRGIYADALVVDETDLIPPSAFDAVFRPALSDRKGWAWFIGTPLGRGHLFKRYENAKKSPNWASWKFDAYQTGIVDADELADLKLTMPADDFAREFMVDFDVAMKGAFYAKQIATAEDEGRMLPVGHNPKQGVMAAWHFAYTDSICITFWQRDGQGLNCIDELWQQQTDFGELLEEIESRDYRIDRHFAPGHIADAPGGRLDQARGLGIKFRQSEGLSEMDQVYATKPFLANCRFNTTMCSDTVEALRQYRAEYDEIKQVYLPKPVDDWTQEFSRSVAVMATSFNPRRSDWSKPIEYERDRREKQRRKMEGRLRAA